MAEAAVEKQDEFPDTPEGWAARWSVELKAAETELEKWRAEAAKCGRRYRDEREGEINAHKRHLNLYSANIQTQEAMVSGRTPKVDVTRRFSDAKDDVARAAGEIAERLLNTDIERPDDTYAHALDHARQDELIRGLGIARVRYDAKTEQQTTPAILDEETGEEQAPAVTQDVTTDEDVAVDYVHWRDFLWSAGARTWNEVRWVAFRAELSREALVKRFPKEGPLAPLDAKRGKQDPTAEKSNDPWSRASVWEVWSKEHGQVFWVVKGHKRVLDQKPDLYELDGFWPCPEPMLSNTTTDSLVPRSDYALAADLYEEIDELTVRIGDLERAVKVVGMYDGTAEGFQRMLKEGVANELIPVKNWKGFLEKGGMAQAVAWLPLEMIVMALDKLMSQRAAAIDLLYQVTGNSDIMRGQATQTDVTATEQGIKAKFASVRIQARQDRFARFASDLQRLRFELIAKRFDPQRILERSNALLTFDAELAQQAVALIKDKHAHYRVQVKPESVSLTDFAALKAEKTEVLTAVGGFLQTVMPLAQAMPGATPFLLEILQWAVAGLKGSSTMEGILDRAIAAAQQAQAQAAANPQSAQPDPKLMAAQAKGQIDMQKEQAKLQHDLIRINAETDANRQRQQDQTEQNLKEMAGRELIKAQGHHLMGGTPGVSQPSPHVPVVPAGGGA